MVLTSAVQANLVGWWKFDEGSGTTAIDSASSNDGTVTSSTWVTGVIDGAIDPGGIGKIDIPAASVSSVGSEVSIAFWAYGDPAMPVANSMVSAFNPNGRALNIHLPWTNSYIYWDAGNDADGYDRISKATSPDIYIGVWNHWVFTKNTKSGDMKIYLNNRIWHSATGKTKTMSGITSISICYTYDGAIDDYRIYDHELSAGEIAKIYAYGSKRLDDVEAWNNVNDYVFAWWADGLRDAAMVFNIQTSRYGLSFDYDDLGINTFGPINNPATEQQALKQDNSIVNSLPAADIDCVIENNSNRYTDTGAGSSWKDCQLIESGKFFHRKWLKGLTFNAGAPTGSANLEISAWPDRINFSLYFAPGASMTNGAIEITIDVGSIYSSLLSNGSARALAVSSTGAGYIFVKDDSNATLTCDSTNTKCTVRLAPGTWSAGEENSVGITVYPVADDCRGRLAAAEMSESTGISVTAAQTAPISTGLTSTYQSRYGWYKIDLRNDVSSSDNDAMERVALTLENINPSDVEVRLNFNRAGSYHSIVGISSILCDESSYPTGIPIQLSKNWHRKDPPERYDGPWFKGLTMLTVPANTTLNLTYTKVSEHWGGIAAASHAQLSLVGWGGNQLWDESAIGGWGETITYDPDINLNRSMIDDCRPLMVYVMNNDTPVKWGWTNNVGGCDFLAYWDTGGNKVYNSNMKTRYTKYCPCMTDVTYAGYGAGGKIKISCTASLYRTDDYVRAIYDLDYEVLDSVAVNTNPDSRIGRIAFFQLGADGYNNHTFNMMARGDASGLVEEWAPVKGGNTYSRFAQICSADTPWFSLHQAVSRDTSLYGAWANRGMVVRSYDAKLGGTGYTRPYYSVYGTTNGGVASANVELSVPADITQLQAGDYVKAQVVYIIVPQFAADYYGPNANLATALTTKENTWRMIYREAVVNDLTVTASTGTVLSEYPIRIKALRNQAQFIVNGGLGYIPVTFTNLQDYRGFTLERKDGSNWIPVDQSVHGNDFWQTDYDAISNTWQITYNLPLDSPNDVPQDVEFRVKYIQTGDLNYDGRIDNKDYCILANDWSEEESEVDIAPEPLGDGKVDFRDLGFLVEYWLTATTIPPLPVQASTPYPANHATGIAPDANLSWTADTGAISHDVYIGTSNPPPFISNVSVTTFVPGWLPYQTNIYWRIDEINGWGRTTGQVWKFTTMSSPPPLPGQASNPNPADSATGVSIDQDLSWTPGSGAISHDVYFGTSMILPFIQNQTAATFDPGRMEIGTKYYWCVNEKTTSGTIFGPLWSFTTSTVPPPPPPPP